MSRPTLALAIALALVLAALPRPSPANDFQVIAYHDVRDNVREMVDIDQYAISTRHLIDHFTWLRVNGFIPVSIDDILAARRGERKLPDNAVVLTFDDGFSSVYTRVYPLLRLFNYPAVVSIVTGWTSGESVPPDDDPTVARHEFLTWEQIKEMQASGLVEVASHSHDLHGGILANPFGNTQPAVNTRRYRDGRYETAIEYAERIRADLSRSSDLIAEHVGVRPRVMTWPYGAYNSTVVDIATELGMPITLTLDSGKNSLDSLSAVSRHLVQANPEVHTLGFDLLYENGPPIIRAAHVDLDYVYDPDIEQQERNLGHLLDRIKALQISHVFLQAFADPDADGGAQALYFPNRHLPVRADLFNRAMWQLKTRANVSVYAWLPILSFEGAGIDPSMRVVQSIDGVVGVDPSSEPRLSPFVPEARRIIREIYEDLAQSAPVAGILFHDDGRLNEFEDAHPAALQAYRSEFGDTFSIEQTLLDPALQQRWAEYKSRAIVELTDELMAAVHEYQPTARSARNMFSGVLLDPQGETYLAQNYELFANHYDHIALMAMPYFENAKDPIDYFSRLLSSVSSYKFGPKKTIFELQTVDWRTNHRLSDDELRRTMRWLQASGIMHIAYYPDDFIEGFPNIAELRRGISLAQYPVEVPK